MAHELTTNPVALCQHLAGLLASCHKSTYPLCSGTYAYCLCALGRILETNRTTLANGVTRKSRKHWLIVALILAAVTIYVAIAQPWETSPIPVALETLVSGPVSQVLAVNGRIAARTSVTVRAAVSAQALSFRADEGEHVTAGQVLLKLDTAIIDAQAEQATAALESQEALQLQAQAAVDRARALGATTARSVLEDAEFRLAIIRQNTARLEAALRQVQRQLVQFTVRSPMTGVVVTRGVDPGQLVDLQTELFVIADTGDLVVETDVMNSIPPMSGNGSRRC